uniref:choice-of-anchor L domain-containing protein n=1 Tax=Flavobacterium sp. TaxID=239 RepID=UPI003F6A4FB4
MKKITLILLMTLSSLVGFSQIVLQEGFEGTNLPEASGNWTLGSGNWRVFDNGVGLNETWNVVENPNPAVYAGSRSAYLNRENVTNGTFASDWLVTPQITVPANGQLRFFARQVTGGNAGSVYTVRVSTSSNPQANLVAGDFTTVQTYSETGVGNPAINTVNGVYEEQLVSLAAYPAGTQVYIAFEMTNDFGDRFLLDDVKVVSQCLDPTLLTATNIGLNSATLGWTNNSTATNFEVEVFDTLTGLSLGIVPATGTSVVYPGLMPSTAYQFYVRALCADGITSEWVGPFNFTSSSPGQTCDAPITVASIPYQVSGSTLGFGDDYSGSPGTGCSTTAGYLNGDDVFYTFVADSNDPIKITNQTNTNWSGLFVYTGCSNVGVSCVAGSTAGNGNTTADQVIFTPVAGQTYYVVISTFAGTNGTNQSCDYTLTIVKNTCTNLSATFNVVSNCSSGTDTFFVTANVSNMGSATSIVGVTSPVSTTETLLAPGLIQFGPFDNNTNVIINLQNTTDNNCFKNSPVLTQTFCPAPNNLCADAIDITCNSTFSDTTEGATSVGAPTIACGTGPGSGGLWYKYTGTGDIVTFSLCGSTYDTKLQVYTGACGNFTCVTGNDNFAGCGNQSQVQIATALGQEYFVYVYGAGTSQGTFTLNTTCITPPPPPANDDCTAAINVPVNTDGTCTLITTGTVVGATQSQQLSTCAGSPDDDVWYSFVATQTSHTLTLDNIQGSDLDLNHAVYSSLNATTPCDALTQVLCNTTSNFSLITGLTVNQTYFVRIYTATTDLLQTTTFDLCISVPPPPPSNDDCATPLTVVPNPSNTCTNFTSGTISSATASPETNACGGSDDDDVWFQFTATNSSHIISLLNINGTVTDLNFVVYSGSCGALTQLLCSLPDSGSITNLTPGATYLVRVYSATATTGQFANFDVCVTSPPISVNNTQYTVQELITDVLVNSPCAQISNITWKTGNTNNFGSTNGIAYFQENAPGTLPFGNGIVMTTGDALKISGPNNAILSDGNTAWTGDADLEAIILAATGQAMNSRNATVIEFDFVPLVDQISFDFMFASDEYGTFQCSFSDSFAFLLTNTITNTTSNLALVPNTTTPISVVTVRDAAYNAGCASVNPTYFDVFNGAPNTATAATNFNGQTVQFTAASQVTPLIQYHIKMVIADRSDNAYDSGVFLKANSFNIGTIELGDDFLEANGNAICAGESYTIVSGLDPNDYTFFWTNNAGVIPGETGPNLTVTDESTYTINATYIGSTCAATDSLTIEFYPDLTASEPNNLIACNATGFATFDLTENNAVILNGLNPSDYTISYHNSSVDAEDGLNPINPDTAYTNVIQGLETIYVRIINTASGCQKVFDFDLIIQDLTPQFTVTPDFSLCDGSSGNITVTPINFVDADVTYTWTLGTNTLPDTGNTISVSQAGTYTVVVNNSGCTATQSTTVTITPIPTPDMLSDVTFCDSYTLQGLNPNNNYYTGPAATGTMLNAGDVISSTQTLYIYADSGTNPNCFAESSFLITINSISADVKNNVSECDSYVLESLSSNNNYYTGPGATGTMLNAGDVISSSQTIYIYAQTGTTPNCTNESSFEVTINTAPLLDPLANTSVTACNSFVLPSLISGNSYYTGSNGSGSMLAAGSTVTTSQTLYILASSGTTPDCTSEGTYAITITNSPEIVSIEGDCIDNVYTLTATVSGAGTQAVTYEWRNSSNDVVGTNSATYVPTSDGEFTCTVSVTLANNTLCSSSATAFMVNSILCTIQKGISPNGDGLNENFDLTGLNVKKLSIFNRYGK